jgi:hypothetical protein
VRLASHIHSAYLMEHLRTVSPLFHRHHDTYATVLIAPYIQDSVEICARLTEDNHRRAKIVGKGEADPGRDGTVDWFEVRVRFCCYLSTH